MTREWRYRKAHGEKALMDNYKGAVAQLKEANTKVEELKAEKKVLQNIIAELENGLAFRTE
jgi:hypothetical protein